MTLDSGQPIPAPSASDEFLQSQLTRALIGKKADHYLDRWAKLLEATGHNFETINKKRSWNWPAFLLPYSWLLYRKLYVLGAIFIAFQLVALFGDVLFSTAVARSMTAGLIGASVVSGLYGNSWYLDATYKKWKRLSALDSDVQQQRAAASEGGTNMTLAIASPVLLMLMALVPAIMSGELYAAPLGCSESVNTNTVKRLVRERIDADDQLSPAIDSKTTEISLSNIQTQDTGATTSKCAARLTFNVALKPGASSHNAKSNFEQTLNRDITYTVERTEKGDQAYVTVYGLK